MTRQSVHLQKELQEAYEHQRQMREEHRKIIHQVAVSPVKKNKRIQDPRPFVKESVEKVATTPAAPAAEVPAGALAAEGIIAAYRPEPPTTTTTTTRRRRRRGYQRLLSGRGISGYVWKDGGCIRGKTHGITASGEVCDCHGEPSFLDIKEKSDAL